MKGVRTLFFAGVIGKLLGVGRELLLAYLYGTGTTAAAYRIAQSATLIPVNFITADALSAGFLPNHSRLLSESAAKASVLYRVVRRYVLSVGLLVALGLVVSRELVIDLLAPGFDDGASKLAMSMLVVMALGVPFYLTTGMGSYVEMSHGTYRLASVRASVQSVGLVIGTLAGYYLERPTLLAWGFTGAYMLLAVWTFHRLRTLGILRTHTAPDDYSTRDALGQFWRSVRPVILMPFALQGAMAVERATASLISHGTVAAVDYARLVTDTASVLIAAPLGLAVLTSLSVLDPTDSRQRLSDLLTKLFAVLIPASLGLACLASPLTVALFQRGAFDSGSTDLVRDVLVGLGAGLWAQVASYVLVKGLNAQGRNGAACLVVIVGSLVTITLDVALYQSLGAVALGIGVSVGGLVQLVLAAYLLGAIGDVCRQLAPYLAPTTGVVACTLAVNRLDSTGLAEVALDAAALAVPLALGYAASDRLRADLSDVLRTALRRSK